MKKKLLLPVLLFVFIVSNAFGSFTFIIPNLNGSNGNQIIIPVKVKDFTYIVSTQGTIHWDKSILEFDTVQQFGMPGLNISNFGMTMVNTNGDLTFSWYDGTTLGVTLPDSTVIFSVVFHIIGNIGQISPVTVVDVPTSIEISDNLGNILPYVLVNGSVTVVSTVGIKADFPDGNNPDLLQNYPNPFSGFTTIEFTLGETSETKITVLDVTGKKIKEISGKFSAGRHTLVWSGEDINGKALSSGVYFLRLESGNQSETRKMIYAR